MELSLLKEGCMKNKKKTRKEKRRRCDLQKPQQMSGASE
jgi:hypothetical protein